MSCQVFSRYSKLLVEAQTVKSSKDLPQDQLRNLTDDLEVHGSGWHEQEIPGGRRICQVQHHMKL